MIKSTSINSAKVVTWKLLTRSIKDIKMPNWYNSSGMIICGATIECNSEAIQCL